MMIAQYAYSDPQERGYTKIQMSTKEYETLIGRKARNKKTQYREVYTKVNSNGDTHYVVQHYTRVYIKVLVVIAFPILVLINGLTNLKQLCKEVKELWNEKKYGSFVSDSFVK